MSTLRSHLILSSILVLSLGSQDVPLDDAIEAEALDAKTLRDPRRDIEPTVDIEALPPGLAEYERGAWDDRAGAERDLRIQLSGAVKRRQMTIRQSKQHGKKGDEARGRLQSEGPLYFPNTLIESKEGWHELRPGTQSWSEQLDRTLGQLSVLDPRRWCEEDLSAAPAFSFALRIRLTLVDAFVSNDAERMRELEARWRRWIFRGELEMAGLRELPEVRASRDHAPPTYVPARIADRESLPLYEHRGPNRDLTTWRRAARVDYTKSRRDTEDYLARVKEKKEALEAKLSMALGLGNQGTIRDLEGAIESEVARRVDAGEGELGYEQMTWTLDPPGGGFSPWDYSLRCLVVPHYAAYSQIGAIYGLLDGHISDVLTGNVSKGTNELKEPAPQAVLEEWAPLRTHLVATMKAIDARDFREARRLVGKLRLWVLDPEEGPLTAIDAD